MDAIYWIAEQKIREAIVAGEFDNLPGRGQPIHFERETSKNSAMNIAFKILKDAGFVPPPIEIRKELEIKQNALSLLIKEARDRKSKLRDFLGKQGIRLDFSDFQETNGRQKFIMNRNIRQFLDQYNKDVLDLKKKYHFVLREVNRTVKGLQHNCIRYEIQTGRRLSSFLDVNFVDISAKLAEFDAEFQVC